MSNRTKQKFAEKIKTASENSKSRIILALDLDFRKDRSNLLSDAEKILDSTAQYLCAIKINLHLIIPLSLNEIASLNDVASSQGLVSIADIKLNDINNTNRVATDYLWDAGFSAVIVNPFVGYQNALDVVLESAHKLGNGVITLAYMSHIGADECYGLKLSGGKTMFELFLEKANSWNADGVILGSTRPEMIREARKVLKKERLILSPGSGAQGGDPIQSLESGTDYLIFGRSIMSSKSPRESAEQTYRKLLTWKGTR